MSQDLVTRLRKRAEIRLTAKGRKSVAEGKDDRLAALLNEAAMEIEELQRRLASSELIINILNSRHNFEIPNFRR